MDWEPEDGLQANRTEVSLIVVVVRLVGAVGRADGMYETGRSYGTHSITNLALINRLEDY